MTPKPKDTPKRGRPKKQAIAENPDCEVATKGYVKRIARYVAKPIHRHDVGYDCVEGREVYVSLQAQRTYTWIVLVLSCIGVVGCAAMRYYTTSHADSFIASLEITFAVIAFIQLVRIGLDVDVNTKICLPEIWTSYPEYPDSPRNSDLSLIAKYTPPPPPDALLDKIEAAFRDAVNDRAWVDSDGDYMDCPGLNVDEIKEILDDIRQQQEQKK